MQYHIFLEERPSDYFCLDQVEHCYINICDLIFDHFNLESTIKAHRRMKLAMENNLPKRLPIDVKKIIINDMEKYIVIDGNSTAAVAQFSNWQKIPACVLE